MDFLSLSHQTLGSGTKRCQRKIHVGAGGAEAPEGIDQESLKWHLQAPPKGIARNLRNFAQAIGQGPWPGFHPPAPAPCPLFGVACWLG